jgi:hypothetical protein
VLVPAGAKGGGGITGAAKKGPKGVFGTATSASDGAGAACGSFSPPGLR